MFRGGSLLPLESPRCLVVALQLLLACLSSSVGLSFVLSFPSALLLAQTVIGMARLGGVPTRRDCRWAAWVLSGCRPHPDEEGGLEEAWNTARSATTSREFDDIIIEAEGHVPVEGVARLVCARQLAIGNVVGGPAMNEGVGDDLQMDPRHEAALRLGTADRERAYLDAIRRRIGLYRRGRDATRNLRRRERFLARDGTVPVLVPAPCAPRGLLRTRVRATGADEDTQVRGARGDDLAVEVARPFMIRDDIDVAADDDGTMHGPSACGGLSWLLDVTNGLDTGMVIDDLVVTEVMPHSPCRGVVFEGDSIFAVNGVVLSDQEEFMDACRRSPGPAYLTVSPGLRSARPRANVVMGQIAVRLMEIMKVLWPDQEVCPPQLSPGALGRHIVPTPQGRGDLVPRLVPRMWGQEPRGGAFAGEQGALDEDTPTPGSMLEVLRVDHDEDPVLVLRWDHEGRGTVIMEARIIARG